MIEIAQAFKAEGYELFEVGGRVRDKILNRSSNDIDLTTNALPKETKKILNKFGTTFAIGEAYGTIGLMIGEDKIEVTTYRGEVYASDSRKPTVVFGTSILEDLRRRDFTINAIAINLLTNELYDPFNGLKDINNMTIRCVGDDERLNEDPLRMLRAIRFACQLGFKMEVNITNPERLKIISKERIREELVKIMMSPDTVRGIRLLCDTGLMYFIIPEFMQLKSLKQNKYHMKDAFEHTLAVLNRATACDFGQETIIFRLAALLHDIGKPATFSNNNGEIHFYDHHMVGGDMVEAIMKNLRFDSDTSTRVTALVRRHMEPIMLTMHDDMTRRNVARLIRRVSSEVYNDIEMLLALVSCDLSSSLNPRQQMVEKLRALVNEVQAIAPKQVSPIDGNEIMELLNIKPSKLVGEIKEFICDEVIAGNVLPSDKEALRQLVKKYYEEL